MRIRIQIVRTLIRGAAVALVVGLGVAGCGGEKPGSAQKATGLATLEPQEVTILAAADQVDGQADKVVAQCASCQLHMAGKAEYALQAGEYAMHFCSESCKTRFAEDMHASIQALQPTAE